MAELSDIHHLLPPNATPLEIVLSQASGHLLGQIDPDVSRLANLPVSSDEPSDDLLPFLPVLAEGEAVGRWDPTWSAGVKVDTIRQARDHHAIAGTLQAVKDAVARVLVDALYPHRGHVGELHQLDRTFRVKEWWEVGDMGPEDPDLDTTAFEVVLLAGRGQPTPTLTPELERKLRQAIDDVKPLRSRYRLTAGGVDLQTTARVAMGVTAVQLARFTAVVGTAPDPAPDDSDTEANG